MGLISTLGMGGWTIAVSNLLNRDIDRKESRDLKQDSQEFQLRLEELRSTNRIEEHRQRANLDLHNQIHLMQEGFEIASWPLHGSPHEILLDYIDIESSRVDRPSTILVIPRVPPTIINHEKIELTEINASLTTLEREYNDTYRSIQVLTGAWNRHEVRNKMAFKKLRKRLGIIPVVFVESDIHPNNTADIFVGIWIPKSQSDWIKSPSQYGVFKQSIELSVTTEGLNLNSPDERVAARTNLVNLLSDYYKLSIALISDLYFLLNKDMAQVKTAPKLPSMMSSLSQVILNDTELIKRIGKTYLDVYEMISPIGNEEMMDMYLSLIHELVIAEIDGNLIFEEIIKSAYENVFILVNQLIDQKGVVISYKRRPNSIQSVLRELADVANKYALPQEKQTITKLLTRIRLSLK